MLLSMPTFAGSHGGGKVDCKDPKNKDHKEWAAAGFKDTLLRCQMKREVANGDEKKIQPGVQA